MRDGLLIKTWSAWSAVAPLEMNCSLFRAMESALRIWQPVHTCRNCSDNPWGFLTKLDFDTTKCLFVVCNLARLKISHAVSSLPCPVQKSYGATSFCTVWIDDGDSWLWAPSTEPVTAAGKLLTVAHSRQREITTDELCWSGWRSHWY